MKNENITFRFIAQFVINVVIAVLSLMGAILSFMDYGWAAFRYYSLTANIFLGLACMVFAYWNILCMQGKRRYTPTWIKCFKYFAVCATTLTFFVVLGILTPMSTGEEISLLGALSYYFLYREMLFYHLLCPVCGLLSLIYADFIVLKDKKFALMSLAPTAIYAVILTILNINNKVSGPYPFLLVHDHTLTETVLWILILFSLAYLISLLIAHICNTKNKKMKENDESTLTEDMGYSQDGYIINQDCFHDMTYRTIPASENGCGPVAIYNVCLANHQEVTFKEVVREMDLMHFLAVPGPTKLSVMRKYLKRYMPGYSEIHGRAQCLECARTCNKAILRYLEDDVPHFVTFVQVEGDLYRFFNVCDTMEDAITTVDIFFQDHVIINKARMFYW